MQHPQFQAGDVDTKWLEREFEHLKAELQRGDGPTVHAAPREPV